MPWKIEGKITKVPVLYIKVSASGIFRPKDTVLPKQIQKLMGISRERNVSQNVHRMSLLCAVSRDLQYSLIPSFSNYWISAHWFTKSSGRWTCLRYGRNVEVLPTKPQQAAAEQSQTKIAALISSIANLRDTKIGQELIPDTLQSFLSHNTQLLEATIWLPVWYTPTFWCFPFCIFVSIPVAVLWKLWAVQRVTKSGEEKLVWQVFSYFTIQTPFVSCSLTLSTWSLCPQSREHLDPIAHICWLIPSFCHVPDCLEPSHSKFSTVKLSLA